MIALSLLSNLKGLTGSIQKCELQKTGVGLLPKVKKSVG
jgi:hypothetical protein